MNLVGLFHRKKIKSRAVDLPPMDNIPCWICPSLHQLPPVLCHSEQCYYSDEAYDGNSPDRSLVSRQEQHRQELAEDVNFIFIDPDIEIKKFMETRFPDSKPRSSSSTPGC